jgi:hypothetical protein
LVGFLLLEFAEDLVFEPFYEMLANSMGF